MSFGARNLNAFGNIEMNKFLITEHLSQRYELRESCMQRQYTLLRSRMLGMPQSVQCLPFHQLTTAACLAVSPLAEGVVQVPTCSSANRRSTELLQLCSLVDPSQPAFVAFVASHQRVLPKEPWFLDQNLKAEDPYYYSSLPVVAAERGRSRVLLRNRDLEPIETCFRKGNAARRETCRALLRHTSSAYPC